jgi:hypothetical protein
MLKYFLILESCGDGEECIASNYCPPVLNLMLGMNFSADPEQRDELKRNLNDKTCRGKQNSTSFFCCKTSQKSEIDLSAKFSKLIATSKILIS